MLERSTQGYVAMRHNCNGKETHSIVQGGKATPGVEKKHRNFKDNAPSWGELELLRDERESAFACSPDDPETVPLTKTRACCGGSRLLHVGQRADRLAWSLSGSSRRVVPSRWLAAGGAQLVVCSSASLWCAGPATFLRAVRSKRQACHHKGGLVCRGLQTQWRCDDRLEQQSPSVCTSTVTMLPGARTAKRCGSCSRRSAFRTSLKKSTCAATATSRPHSSPRCHQACCRCLKSMEERSQNPLRS